MKNRIGNANHRNNHGAMHLQSFHPRENPPWIKCMTPEERYANHAKHVIQRMDNADFNRRLKSAVERNNIEQQKIVQDKKVANITEFQKSCANFNEMLRCSITGLSCKQKSKCLFFKQR